MDTCNAACCTMYLCQFSSSVRWSQDFSFDRALDLMYQNYVISHQWTLIPEKTCLYLEHIIYLKSLAQVDSS
jgi:hypothetical protein